MGEIEKCLACKVEMSGHIYELLNTGVCEDCARKIIEQHLDLILEEK